MLKIFRDILAKINLSKGAKRKSTEEFFLQTLFLAQQGRGFVAPNPEVGAIIMRDGKILGMGYHKKFGESHAEVNAICNAEKNGHDIAGAEIFVSLEPCCHTEKKTPPCTLLLIEKKIAVVHVFFLDPNPRVRGRGIKILESAGIKIFLAEESLQRKYQNFYEIFSYAIQKKMPFCTLKLAQSKNFFLGERNTQTQISGIECRKKTLELRDQHQSILVGSNTVLVDNPTLAGKITEPLRIVLDASGKLMRETNILKKNFFRDDNYIVVVSEQNYLEASVVFGKSNTMACPFIDFQNPVFDLFALKKNFAQENIFSIFIEGGGKTAKFFLESREVNRFIAYISEKSISEKNAIPGINPDHYNFLEKISEEVLGDDVVFEYRDIGGRDD